MSVYSGKRILVATKHGKEQVVAPAMIAHLGCQVDATFEFDTDQFGTFSGEIKRELSPLQTCIHKAKAAAKVFQADCVIASEGSFGPHPYFPVAAVDHELMVFYDHEQDLVISENVTSLSTNYGQQSFRLPLDQTGQVSLQQFLTRVSFPGHGIILCDENGGVIAKGVQSEEVLCDLLARHSGSVQLQTDMRAMMNPMRMAVIKDLATQLAKRITQLCPQCRCPGFGIKEPVGYLPCEACGSLTNMYKQIKLSCLKCDYHEFQPRPDNKTLASAKYCPVCNP